MGKDRTFEETKSKSESSKSSRKDLPPQSQVENYHPLTSAINQFGNTGSVRNDTAILQSAPFLAQHSLLQLQQQYGNHYVQRVVKLAKQRQREKGKEEISIPRGKNNTHLPIDVQAKMESAFSVDLADIKIHPNSDYASQMQALAMTKGNEIFFAPGKFHPTSRQGQKLLAHEIAHVFQQRQGRVSPTTQLNGTSINDNAVLEREADQVGQAVVNDQMIPTLRESNNREMNSSIWQRAVDPDVDVLMVGHASPRWEYTHGKTREELNLNLAQDRVEKVETYFRDIFNQKYGDRGNPSYDFERMSLDVEVSDEVDSIFSSASGSRETIREAGGNVKANDPSMRRVNLTTRIILNITGTAPSSVPIEETTVEDTRTRRWAVQINVVGSTGEGVGAGFALGSIKNRRTGQTASGSFVGGGIAGGIELPIPSASPSSSWENFTTDNALTFEDLDGEFARLTDLSIGIGVAGYSWAYFDIDGMSESSVPVGGFVMNEWGIGGASLVGRWGFSSIPRPRTITTHRVITEETPYELNIPEQFDHVVYFDTGSAEIDEANLTNSNITSIQLLAIFKHMKPNMQMSENLMNVLDCFRR